MKYTAMVTRRVSLNAQFRTDAVRGWDEMQRVPQSQSLGLGR